MKMLVFSLLLGLTFAVSVQAQPYSKEDGALKLPVLISNNMVLQQLQNVRIWGESSPNSEVTVTPSWNNVSIATKANENGHWILGLGTPAATSIPQHIIVKSGNKSLNVDNILIGEVWLCSGQSNMAMTINGSGGQVYNYKNEVSNVNYPNICLFNVKSNLSAKAITDMNGRWDICTSETVANFSAVGYFFARKIHQETGIPIGIINSSWGGTDIETWISMDTFKNLPNRFKEKYNETEKYGVDFVLKRNEENRNEFNRVVANEIGMEEQWYMPSHNFTSWKLMTQPQEWSKTDLASFDGVVWFKYEFNMLDSDAANTGILSLGKIDDNDITWINGIKIGETEGAGYDRVYNIPSGVLKRGSNTIVIKVTDAIRGGGFTGRKEDFYIETKDGRYSLVGDWQYKPTVNTQHLHYSMDNAPNLHYGLLYNAMINPLTDFAIKGVIWYQGENNTGQAYNYRTLFPTLINDWRKKWGYNFPFYWVQLASYMPKAEQPPVADSWAELREAQTLTLGVVHTGQIVITDIGDANDIHPKNKQDVGLRLANIALNNDYNRSDVIYSGPTYKSTRINRNIIIIEFDNIASGLITTSKYGYIEGFTIAGADHKFVWANAKLEGKNKVIVYSEDIKKPVAVRYCWASNPDVNLFNSFGLPTCPFRTDLWKLSTEH